MYIAVVKSIIYQILFALMAHFCWFAILMDVIIAFLNSEIDVTVYMQLLTGYYNLTKIVLFLKTLYGLKQSACQWASFLNIVL